MLKNCIDPVHYTNLTQLNYSITKKVNLVSSDKTESTGDPVSSKVKKLSNIIKNNDIKNIKSQEMLDMCDKLYEEGASDTVLNNTKMAVDFLENYDSLRNSLVNSNASIESSPHL